MKATEEKIKFQATSIPCNLSDSILKIHIIFNHIFMHLHNCPQRKIP